MPPPPIVPTQSSPEASWYTVEGEKFGPPGGRRRQEVGKLGAGRVELIQPIAGGHPQQPIRPAGHIGEAEGRAGVGRAGLADGIKAGHLLGAQIETGQIVGKQPDHALRLVDKDAPDPRQAAAVALERVVGELLGLRVEAAQPGLAPRADLHPQIPGLIDRQPGQTRVGEGAGVGRVRQIAGEVARGRVEAVQPAVGRGDPEPAGRVLGQRADLVAADGVGVLGIVLVGDEAVAVVADQAFVGAKPHEAAAGLHHRGDLVAGQAVVDRQVAEAQGGPLVELLPGGRHGALGQRNSRRRSKGHKAKADQDKQCQDAQAYTVVAVHRRDPTLREKAVTGPS
jgi:hypothetical protein